MTLEALYMDKRLKIIFFMTKFRNSRKFNRLNNKSETRVIADRSIRLIA